jgi:D-serine deaminase-like pyridoxal phosphate-dependent protein
MPLVLVDTEALDANVARLTERTRATGKTVRLASKSVRSPALMRRIADASGGAVRGVMAYAAGEHSYLAAHGFTDIVVGYPTVQPADLAHAVAANRAGVSLALMVDCAPHVDAIAAAAREGGVVLPVLVDVDVSYRPLLLARFGVRPHLGVRRSPLREPAEVVDLVARIAARPELRFEGVMAYEAHVAGVPDRGIVRRAIKRLAAPRVVEARAAVVRALEERGSPARVVNGGGTGSSDANASEAALTEITVGSGFLASHLFDHYDALTLRPAAFFALQVTRRPASRIVTCHGGGWVASGPSGRDRAPIPAYPDGLSLLGLEGVGEVQTPLRLPRGFDVSIGDPVFFRHAKAGEVAEHANEYLLVQGDRIVDRVKTYRGLGACFL